MRVRALRIRGHVYFNLGEYDNALTDFSKSLDIEPNDTYALSMREKANETLK